MFDTPAQERLHARTQTQRRQLLAKLHSVFDDRLADDISPEEAACLKLHNQIAECGRAPVVYIDRERHRVIRSLGRCGQRHCPTCASIRSRETAQRVLKHIDTMDSPALLTLTLKPDTANLADQLDHLVASVRRMRQTADWKKHIKGGVMCLEVTRNPHTGMWHPHAHLVVDMTYWTQRNISHAWERASQGSTIVDIRRTHSKAGAAQYVSKYIAKTADAASIPAAAMTDWVDGWKGRRRVQTFGTCHGIKTARAKLPTKKPLKVIAQINATEADAKAGKTLAQDIMRQLQDLPRWPDDDNPTPEIRDAHRKLCTALEEWNDQHTRELAPERFAGFTMTAAEPPPKTDDAFLFF